jgi:hypothetical protein
MLREVLAMAADPITRGDHPVGADAMSATGTAPVAPVAPVVAPAEGAGVDDLVRDLRERMETVGLPVVDSPTCADWPLAVALTDPEEPGRRLLAVEVDSRGFAACPSVSTRDRQRREWLERAGWTYLRVAAMDLFCDPAGEVERIRAAWRDLGGDPALTQETQIIVGRPRVRGPFPQVTAGRPITLYSDAELEAVATWVLSDGVGRSAEELAALVREALHLPRRGMHVEAAVGGAARRVLDGAGH